MGPSISRIKKLFFSSPSKCPIDLFGPVSNRTILKQLQPRFLNVQKQVLPACRSACKHGHKGRPNCGIDRIGPRGSPIDLTRPRGSPISCAGPMPSAPHNMGHHDTLPSAIRHAMHYAAAAIDCCSAHKVKPRNEQDTTTLSKIFTPGKGWIRAWFKEQSPLLGF